MNDESAKPVVPTSPACARHPDRPAATTCTHCGSFACSECDSIFEGRHICATCIEEGRVRETTIPWSRRDEIGVLPAAWQTVLEVSGDPVGFFDRLRKGRIELSEAALFSFLVWIPAGVAGGLYQGAMMRLFAGGGNEFAALYEQYPWMEEAIAGMSAGWLGSMLAGVLLAPFLGVCGQLVLGLLHHGALLLFGGATRPLEATLATTMYATGVNFWAVIPVLGFFVSLWVSLCQVIGYSRVHESDWWRAGLAVATPFCCAVCLVGTAVLALVFGLAAASQSLGL
jgi:hypothetical protein